MYETGNGSYAGPERRLVLIHRVIVLDKEYPREHAILVTDRRSIFIRQKKSRSGFVLRSETRYGTALVTDVQPKTLEDYENMSLGSLVADASNIVVPHSSVISLVMMKGEPEFRLRDLFIWLTMRRQGHKFHVYDFEMNYRDSASLEAGIRFYMVPLGFVSSREDKPRPEKRFSVNTLRTHSRISKRSSRTESYCRDIVHDRVGAPQLPIHERNERLIKATLN